MIGAQSSPLSMFVPPGGGGEAFQRGMMIGDANSAASPIARAFQNTIDKYNAHLAAQQEQSNKLEQIKTQYGLMGQNDIATAQAKSKVEADRIATINAENAQSPNAGVRKVDVAGRPIFLQDYTDDKGLKISKEITPPPLPNIEQYAIQQIMDQQGGQGGAPNMIQQGASLNAPAASIPGVTPEYMKTAQQLVDAYKQKVAQQGAGSGR